MEKNDIEEILEEIANLPKLPVSITSSDDESSSTSTVEASTPLLPVVPAAVPPPLSSSSHLQQRRQELPNPGETPSSVFLGESSSLPPWSNPYSHGDSFSWPENYGSWSNPGDQNFQRGGGGRSSPSGHVASSSSYPPNRGSQADLRLGSPLRSVAEAQGRVADVACDMINGRILGDKIANSSPEEVASVAAEIILNLRPLSVHPYGHYVVKKLVEVVDQRRFADIFGTFLVDNQCVITICADEFGSRVMTKVVKRLNGDITRQRQLIASVSSPDKALALNSYSSHLLENCFAYFSYDALKPLIIDVSKHFMEMATTNRSGRHVLQHCINMSFQHRTDDMLFTSLITNIISRSYDLSNDSEGNYVIQYVIDKLKDKSLNSEIFDKLKGRLRDMSTRRESSYVVEKLLRNAENFISQEIVKEIMEPPSAFLPICTSKNGSYVVQECIKQCKLKNLRVFKKLVDLIKMNENELRRSTFGVFVVKTMYAVV